MNEDLKAPVVIGGVGGSGTRVITQIVKKAGFYIGNNVGKANDAKDFFEFFKKWIPVYLLKKTLTELETQDKEFHDFFTKWVSSDLLKKTTPGLENKEMISEFKKCVDTHLLPTSGNKTRWAFKLPRTIFLLPFLHSQFPKMKFIHVLRDGRDMVYSKNEKMLVNFSKFMLNINDPQNPKDKLKFWSSVNLEAAKYGENHMKENYIQIRFEDLCQKKEETTRKIFGFLNVSFKDLTPFLKIIRPPKSIGRWKDYQENLDISEIDKKALKKFNYI